MCFTHTKNQLFKWVLRALQYSWGGIMKTVIIVQARMTSTRLPGKVLKPVLGKSLLEYQIERLKRVTLADSIVIATTTNDTDQPIVELCDRLSVPYIRGSEEDVLARYYEAAIAHQADVVVRITSDCPLIDPAIIDQVIQTYLENFAVFDYVTNALQRTYPRGMDTEVFSFKALREAYQESTAQADREHVTPFINRRPERYRFGHVCDRQDNSSHRWTVDTPEDFELIRRILEAVYPKNPRFSMQDCLRVVEQQPGWSQLNAHIEQKQYGQ